MGQYVGVHPLAVTLLLLIGHSVRVFGEKWQTDSIASRHLQPEKDPLGDVDVHSKLSEKEKKILSHATEVGVNSKLKFLTSLETTVSVHVRLVGFEGDGNLGIKLNEVELVKYMELMKSSTHIPVIHGDNHELSLKNRLFVQASHAPTMVSSEIATLLQENVNAGAPGDTSQLQTVKVPHSTVDRVIQSDFERMNSKEYTIYILNPRSQKFSYLYSYDDPRDCPGTFFVSQKPYIWIDLTAGPVSYGPTEAREGLVSNSSFFQLGRTSSSRSTLLPHVASLASSAVQHFLSPSFLHYPLHFALHTHVSLIHITGEEQSEGGEGGARGAAVDLKAIEEELLGSSDATSLVFPKQSLTFSSSSLSLEKCNFCSLAYATSLRSGGFDQQGSLQAPRIDSRQLNQLLHQFWPEIKSLAGVQDPDFMNPAVVTPGRVIPIFLLDIPSEMPILLEGSEQAVAFDNMVIAVRTRAKASKPRFQCQGQVAGADLSNLTRPVFSALLQTGWGVTPPNMAWSPLHNRTVKEYRWSVGPTPFGPFSHSLKLSFSPRDAARRNVILTLLNETLTDVTHTLDIVKGYGGEDVLFRAGGKREKYTQRWNLLKQKLANCVSMVSQGSFEEGLFYVRSARHDVTALFNVVVGSAGHIQTSLECFKDHPSEWVWYSILAVVGMGVAGVWSNKDKIFQTKLKRF